MSVRASPFYLPPVNATPDWSGVYLGFYHGGYGFGDGSVAGSFFGPIAAAGEPIAFSIRLAILSAQSPADRSATTGRLQARYWVSKATLALPQSLAPETPLAPASIRSGRPVSWGEGPQT